jgi:hypothetical protein
MTEQLSELEQLRLENAKLTERLANLQSVLDEPFKIMDRLVGDRNPSRKTVKDIPKDWDKIKGSFTHLNDCPYLFMSMDAQSRLRKEGYAHLFYNEGYALQCRLKGDAVWLDLDGDTYPILVAGSIEYRIADDEEF